MGVLALVASGCSNTTDECNSRIPDNVHLTLVDAITHAPVRGFAQVDHGIQGGSDDCTDCGGCSSMNVLVTGQQSVRVTADGYAGVTLQVDGGSGSGVCDHTFEDLNEVVQMTAQPGATGAASGIACLGDMSIQLDM
jgi:hypothetical protein